MTAQAISESEFGTGWDDEGESQGGGRWLKIKDGDEVMVNVFGKARRFMKAFKEGEKPSQRWDVLVYNVDSDSVQTFEFGFKVFKQIRGLADRYEKKGTNIADHVLCISRTGSGKNDTQYIVAPDGPLDDSQKAKRQAALESIPANDEPNF